MSQSLKMLSPICLLEETLGSLSYVSEIADAA